MRNYIDENDKKNEIRLLFRHPSYQDKVIFAVEGKTDVRLFRGLVENDRIKYETIDGKLQLLSIMQELVGEFPNQIFAVCDADYDHLTGHNSELTQYSIFMTDEHDAESMLLDSPALDSFITEYSSMENIDEIRVKLLDAVFSAAYRIGLLRWINVEGNLKLIFKGLNFNQFVDVQKLSVNVSIDELIKELVQRSSNRDPKATIEYLTGKFEEFENHQACRLQVCSGHDLTKIISMIFRQRWASVELNMDQRKVESALRVGFQKSYFKETQLCSSICAAFEGVGISIEMC